VAVARNRVGRITRHRHRGPEFARLGKLGKRALGKRILALRDSGPVHVLKWINDDYILRSSFDGLLERLGRTRVTRVKSRIGSQWHIMSDSSQTTTVEDLGTQIAAQFHLIGAGANLRYHARTIRDALAMAPKAWLDRIRRCRYARCERPYFWDSTDAGVKKTCSPAHKTAALRHRSGN
jgi:hypothetical protein